jgi:hypothetical protein
MEAFTGAIFNDYKYKDNEKFGDTYIRYLVQSFMRFKACPIELFLLGIVRNYSGVVFVRFNG